MDQIAPLLLGTTKRYSAAMPKQTRTDQPRSRLAALRATRGLTQERLAERLGWTREKIAKLERGDIWFSKDSAHQLAKALECGVWELMDDAPEISPEDMRFLTALKSMTPEQQQRFAAVVRGAFELAGLEAPDLPQ